MSEEMPSLDWIIDWLNVLETYHTRKDTVNLLARNESVKENHEAGRNEGLKCARKHSMLLTGCNMGYDVPVGKFLKRSLAHLDGGKARTRRGQLSCAEESQRGGARSSSQAGVKTGNFHRLYI